MKKDLSVHISARGGTHVGRVRATNQDYFLVDPKEGLFIVADGMGGHAGGEVASKLCVEQIRSFLQENADNLRAVKTHPSPVVLGYLMEAINFASTKIYENALEQPMLRGMGTTATVLKVIDNVGYVGHVGDSRLYLIRAGFIYQISLDHSFVNEQVRAGVLSREEAEQHHLKNVITRSVGYQEEEDVDTVWIEFENGDYVFMCSDGLHGKLSDVEIADSIKAQGLEAVEELISKANENGGEDNITLVIVKVEL